MAVPKRKSSKSKIRMRKKSHRTVMPSSAPCAQCGAPKELHRVCGACGYYAGRAVLSIESD